MDATPADGSADESAGSPLHDHRWSGMAFFFADDRPWFRMRCACGAERTIRAWERYSEPDPASGGGPPTDDPRAPDG